MECQIRQLELNYFVQTSDFRLQSEVEEMKLRYMCGGGIDVRVGKGKMHTLETSHTFSRYIYLFKLQMLPHYVMHSIIITGEFRLATNGGQNEYKWMLN